MIVSDVGHKIVFNQAGAPKPSAKASHGTHQRRNPLSPRHNKSRSAPEELDALLLIWNRPNENSTQFLAFQEKYSKFGCNPA